MHRHDLELEGLASDDAAEADDSVVSALLRQREGGDGKLERSGHPEDVGILDAVTLQRLPGAPEKSVGDVVVGARDDDRELQVGAVEVGGRALLSHALNYSR